MKSLLFEYYKGKTLSIKLSDGTYITGLVHWQNEVGNSIQIKTLTDDFVISCSQIISFKVVGDKK
jgi:hypothetical protein